MSPTAPSLDAPRVTILAALLLVGPAFSGCLAGDGGSGTAAFYVKDAPSDDFAHVNVTFTKVSVHAAEGDEDGNETDDGDGGAPDSSGDGWETVFEGERTVDLLDYNASEARALLGVGELEAGTYNQVVIHVSSAHGIHADDGSQENFTVTTGWVKLTRAWTVQENATTHVTADIDLDRSIVRMGPNGYRLNPVVGQVLVEQNDEEPDSRTSGGADDADNGSDEAQASMYVKDAPTDEFDEIWLRFDEVQVHLAGDGNETADGNETSDPDEGNETNGNDTDEADGNETSEQNETEDADGDDGRWITAVNTSRAIDLLRFSEPDAKAFLGDATLPEGKYTQIRVNVTEAWGIENGTGDNETITVASESAKVNKPWRLEANDTVAQVTIDLNLDRSLKERGGQGWLMTPVIGSVAMDWVPDDPGEDRPDGAADDNGADEADGNETDDGQSTNASSPQQTGDATAYVKDAPTDEFREIWLTFDEVEVHYAGNGTDEADDGNDTADANETDDGNQTDSDDGNQTSDANETDDGEWRTLFDGTRSVNLLNFSEDDSRAFLGDAELTVGRYTQIRVNVTDAWGIDNETGERENITVSSGTVKVVRSFEVTANDTTQIVVDVDLDQSLHQQGGGPDGDGPWRLTPVVGMVAVDHVDEDPRADQADGAGE